MNLYDSEPVIANNYGNLASTILTYSFSPQIILKQIPDI